MAQWMHAWARLWRHRWTEGQVQRDFPPAALQRLEQAVAASERQHSGQVRVCVEGGLPYSYLWRGASARERAIGLFGKLRVWDTEHNNGVLLYVLLAEHAIEIVADRAVARCVPAATWQAMVQQLQNAFQRGAGAEGLEQAIAHTTQLLATHFPPDAGGDRPDNELPDAPVVQGRFRKDR